MLFNSYEFIFLFLPLSFFVFYFCNIKGKHKMAWGALFLLSLIFYGWSYPRAVSVLLGSLLFNYVCSILLRKRKDIKLLFIGIAVNLLVLAFFKYFGSESLSAPGISFFTFTQIAFLAECWRGGLSDVTALQYGTYVTFFPKLMQGPIALPEEWLGQLKGFYRIQWEDIYRCLLLFAAGLFKKVILADTLGKAVDFGYGNLGALNSADGLILILSYTLQLYFDFSGYCDMAMGIAGLFGIRLPVNFNSPYKAANIIEFWQGWHITLTGFFTKYLYIPLGGSRKGRARTYLNCFLVFLVSGIWHGSGWQFIVWGMMHGLLYVATRAFFDGKKKNGEQSLTTGKGLSAHVRHGLGVFFTFVYVNIAWVFFRAPSVKDALALLGTVLRLDFGRLNWDLASCFNLDEFWYVIKLLKIDRWQYAHYIIMVLFLLVLLLVVFFGRNAVSLAEEVTQKLSGSFAKLSLVTLVMAVLFVWSVLAFSQVSSFLYFNF